MSWLHVLSWDLAGIMDKVLYGDYLAKVPRVSNIVYTLVFLIPFLVPPCDASLLGTRAARQLFGVLAVVALFAGWATIGYAAAAVVPELHRSLAAVTRTLAGRRGACRVDEREHRLAIVQVLRFPHRFQLLLFVLAPVVMSLTLAWAVDALHNRWMVRRGRGSVTEGGGRPATTCCCGARHVVAVGAVFFAPLLSNTNYRTVLPLRNFGTSSPHTRCTTCAPSKPSSRRSKRGRPSWSLRRRRRSSSPPEDGIDHKFIDKFFIYYLDVRATTTAHGDSSNSSSFPAVCAACTTSRTGGSTSPATSFCVTSWSTRSCGTTEEWGRNTMPTWRTTSVRP